MTDFWASMERGLADSAAGRVNDLGDFAQYADDRLPGEFFVDLDGHREPTIWQATENEFAPEAVLRRSDLFNQNLWPVVVARLTGVEVSA